MVSGVEPGSAHDLTAARAHALPALCHAAATGLPTLADPGYDGAGIGILILVKQPANGRPLDVDTRTRNTLLRSLRCLGERAFALPAAGAPCSTSPPVPARSALVGADHVRLAMLRCLRAAGGVLT